MSGSIPYLVICSWILVSVHLCQASSLITSCRILAYKLEPACGLTYTPFLTKYIQVSFRASVVAQANHSTLHSSKSSLNSSHSHCPVHSFLFQTASLQAMYILTWA